MSQERRAAQTATAQRLCVVEGTASTCHVAGGWEGTVTCGVSLLDDGMHNACYVHKDQGTTRASRLLLTPA